jgi:hypothetical protein
MEKLQPVVLEDYFTAEEVSTMLFYPTKIQRPSYLPNMLGALGFKTSLEADLVSMENPVTTLTGDEKDDGSILKFTEAVLRVKKEMESFFELEMSMVNCNYAVMLPGSSNPLHSDDSHLDGSKYHEDEEVEYSALIYLGQHGIDYEGGEILFPLQDVAISPKLGTVVFFKGDHYHPHEVTPVTKGERKAVVLFFAIKGNVSDKAFFSDSHSGVPDSATE